MHLSQKHYQGASIEILLQMNALCIILSDSVWSRDPLIETLRGWREQSCAFTLYNVCTVHCGLCSALGMFSALGIYHECIRGIYHERIRGIYLPRGDIISTFGEISVLLWNTPNVLIISPTQIMISPNALIIFPNALMIPPPPNSLHTRHTGWFPRAFISLQS